MSDPYFGEIRIFAGPYAPQNWAFCDGTIVNVADYETLYSLIGNTYGGSPPATFALPDLRGRLPVHRGQGPGLTNRLLGQRLGTESVTLVEAQFPPHNHPMRASTDAATSSTPSTETVMAAADPPDEVYGSTTDSTKINTLANNAVQASGGSQPHSNLMPALCLNFIICLRGIYPDRP